jgi:hypothetical protein
LHPAYKLEYFKSAGWEYQWLQVAEDIVRAEFDKNYSTLPIVTAEDHSENKMSDSESSDNGVEKVH